MFLRLLGIRSAQNEEREGDLNMNPKRMRKLINPTFLFFSFVICLAFVAGAQSSFAQSSGSADVCAGLSKTRKARCSRTPT